MMSAQHSQQSCEAGEHENGEEQLQIVLTYFAALCTETLADAELSSRRPLTEA